MIIVQMLRSTFPAVKKQLAQYKKFLIEVKGPLAEQGLASIRDKEFHCLGGSVYALLASREERWLVLRFIVAFQTISDYLDNLCDRFGIHSEPVFRQLHSSMLDCLEPHQGGYSDYYSLFPYQDDGGYLQLLVEDCRNSLSQLSGFNPGKDKLIQLTKLYIDLQSFKHMEWKQGEECLVGLHRETRLASGLYWWEFAAACGSTLGIFAVIAAGREQQRLFKAYMPWINGFHILLDYYIDQEEDRRHDDMNFIAYYENMQTERLLWFYRKAGRAVKPLAKSRFHSLVLDGLLALYLSDPKAWSEELADSTISLLRAVGRRAQILEKLARLLRRCRII